jgi:hypothetical protein
VVGGFASGLVNQVAVARSTVFVLVTSVSASAQPGADFSPSDQQEWADGVEGGFAVGAGDQWVGDVQLPVQLFSDAV